MMAGLSKVAAAAFGMQALGFAIAAPLQTDRFYDLFGSSTFAVCVGISLLGKKSFHPRQLLLSAMTLTWSLRLGSFLVYRISKDGKDSRFDKIKKDPLRFAGAWFMQGVWVFITAYPVYFINSLPAAKLASIGILDGLGLALWLIGFNFEAIADYQKMKWQERIGEKGRKENFINEGLWR
jgi:steroid 5-alpha reductase family enzyme